MISPTLFDYKLDICATDNCNRSCSQCNRCCNVAAANKYISVSDVERMCAEFQCLGKLKSVQISGGEPMMHPDIENIVKIILDSGITENVSLWTNGTINSRNLALKHKIVVYNDNKDKGYRHVWLMTVAPIDMNLYGIKPLSDCTAPRVCGIAYSRRGYYPCCFSEAIGRIFKIDGIKSMREMTNEAYNDLLDKTCRYCGYYLTGTKPVFPPFSYPAATMSPSWSEAIKKYNALPEEQK